jgi:predicted acyltransferase
MISSPSNRIPDGRLLSIDALRGFDMFWIIGLGGLFTRIFTWMDNPVSQAFNIQLEHSAWNGFTFEDLIFPLFLFIVGLTIPFSLTKRLARGESRRSLYGHIFMRFLLLFFLGLIYNGLLNFNFPEMRWAGVLQRISLCYLACALIVMNGGVKVQVVWAGALLLLYWAAMMLIPVPGYGAGVLTPEGNLAAYIDRMLLPGRFCCYTFGDNEGLLSTIPAVSTTLIGVLCGHWLRSPNAQKIKALRLVIAGIASLILAILWGILFPINKLLWSSSYVLFAAGWSMLLLALFYWLIDMKGYVKWAFPLIVVGLNPITIYVAQGVFDFGIIARIFIHGFVDYLGTFKPMFTAFCVLGVKWLFLWFLYTRRIFLKV